jgi:hypothetical protein
LFLVAWMNVAALLEIYPTGPILDRWSNFLFGMLYSVTRGFHHLSIPSNYLGLISSYCFKVIITGSQDLIF